jgi:hypothetical protein
VATEVDSTSGLLALARAHGLNDKVVFIGDFQRTILELSCMALGAQRALKDFSQEGVSADEATARKIRSIQRSARDALEWLNLELKKTYDDDTIPKFIWEQLPDE